IPQVPTRPLPPITGSTIYVTGGVVGISGYDNFVFEIIKGLRSLGIDVRINNICPINRSFCPQWFGEVHMPRIPDSWEIIINPPCHLHPYNPTKKSIIYTMWETDYLEAPWVDNLNRAAFIIVPSQWAVDTFKKSGVRVPIYKNPLG